MKRPQHLPQVLTHLVRDSVALLGSVIQRELGMRQFKRIENLRIQMTKLRAASPQLKFTVLNKAYRELQRLEKGEQYQIAQAFTLMLELMNACENAYRSYRLGGQKNADVDHGGVRANAIVYVLTAHPTEARAPQNIEIFHQIQQVLTKALLESDHEDDFAFLPRFKITLMNLLEIAWRTNIVRSRAPKVKDEADHLYSLLFREGILLNLLDRSRHATPFFVRSWVGGDKDGHPGVDEKTLLESLTLSRGYLLRLVNAEFKEIRKNIDLFSSQGLGQKLYLTEQKFNKLKKINTGDAKSVRSAIEEFRSFKELYFKTLGSLDPRIEPLVQLFFAFPAMVVPLELREASDVLMSKEIPHQKRAIFKMLKALGQISQGGDPKAYARGFIISMTESIDHILMAAQFQKEAFGEVRLPIIPLFEQSKALEISDQIMDAFTRNRHLKYAAKRYWDSRIEMMVGYSDSSKEAGALSSRLHIAEALPRLEKLCLAAGFVPVFFHGSGGSIDRGGGTIEDQTAWWPRSALNFYKVTIQGEMVERSFASLLIAERQVQKISESIAQGLSRQPSRTQNQTLELFAKKVARHYHKAITSQKFLRMVESATPYSFLNILKIGSRPTKRNKKLSVEALRAIPWVLCWTQTRVLFQTWWGIGSSWKELTVKQKRAVRTCFKTEPIFTSYIKALGFTLAKVELSVWKLYLEKSHLTEIEKRESYELFEKEFTLARNCYQEICGKSDLMWAKPWLGESISLRSPMIHPLNMIQILAKNNKDLPLLRLSVTGISSGMMTTG